MLIIVTISIAGDYCKINTFVMILQLKLPQKGVKICNQKTAVK